MFKILAGKKTQKTALETKVQMKGRVEGKVAPCHEGVWGSGCIDPRFLDLSTSWRWSASRPTT
jgi:hypothetical protein